MLIPFPEPLGSLTKKKLCPRKPPPAISKKELKTLRVQTSWNGARILLLHKFKKSQREVEAGLKTIKSRKELPSLPASLSSNPLRINHTKIDQLVESNHWDRKNGTTFHLQSRKMKTLVELHSLRKAESKILLLSMFRGTGQKNRLLKSLSLLTCKLTWPKKMQQRSKNKFRP